MICREPKIHMLEKRKQVEIFHELISFRDKFFFKELIL